MAKTNASIGSCPGCGARFPHSEGPVHDYMESSPGCWQAFGEVLARDYGNTELMAVHRLSVDAYAVQHPGGDSRQAIQSVGMHLVRLGVLLEHNLPPERANTVMLHASKIKASMHKLPRPASLGDVTVADVLAAQGAEAHVDAVRRWARSAWSAWEASHDVVRGWTGPAPGQRR